MHLISSQVWLFNSIFGLLLLSKKSMQSMLEWRVESMELTIVRNNRSRVDLVK